MHQNEFVHWQSEPWSHSSCITNMCCTCVNSSTTIDSSMYSNIQYRPPMKEDVEPLINRGSRWSINKYSSWLIIRDGVTWEGPIIPMNSMILGYREALFSRLTLYKHCFVYTYVKDIKIIEKSKQRHRLKIGKSLTTFPLYVVLTSSYLKMFLIFHVHIQVTINNYFNSV